MHFTTWWRKNFQYLHHYLCPNLKSFFFLMQGSVCSEWAGDPRSLASPATGLYCLRPALASEQVFPPRTAAQAARVMSKWCGKCLSRIFVVFATSMPPSSLPDRQSFLFWWVSHSVILHDLQLNFLFKERLLHIQHQTYPYQSPLNVIHSQSFPSVTLALPMSVLRLGKHQSVLILSRCKHPKTRTHGWFILYSYTICLVHGSLLMNVERRNEWWVSAERMGEWLPFEIFLDSAVPQTSVLELLLQLLIQHMFTEWPPPEREGEVLCMEWECLCLKTHAFFVCSFTSWISIYWVLPMLQTCSNWRHGFEK